MSSGRLVVWGLAMALLLASAGPSRAGSKYWSFLVLDVVQLDGGAHLIRLQPSPAGKKFPQSCSNFIVRAYYDLEGWTEASRESVTRETHDRSVRLLVQAQATRSVILVGAIGRGFGAESEDSACDVVSRGLQVLLDPTGMQVIFSVYEDPRTDGNATIR